MKKLLLLVCFLGILILCPYKLVSASSINSFPEKYEEDKIWASPGSDEIYYMNQGTLKKYNITSGDIQNIKDLTQSTAIYVKNDTAYYLDRKDWTDTGINYDLYSINLLTNEDKKMTSISVPDGNEAEELIVDDKYIYIGSEYINRPTLIYDYEGKQLATIEGINATDIHGTDSSERRIWYENLGCLRVLKWNLDNTVTKLDKNITMEGFNGNDDVELYQMLENRYMAVSDLDDSNDTLYLLDCPKIKAISESEFETNAEDYDNIIGICLKDPEQYIKVSIKFLTDNFSSKGLDPHKIKRWCSISGDNVFAVTAAKQVKAYSLSGGNYIGKFQTSHPVERVMTVHDQLVLLEKEGDQYFVEKIDSSRPTEISLDGPSEMKVGDSSVFTETQNSEMTEDYIFTSSDSKVLSISKYSGKAGANQPGTATITVKTRDGRIQDSIFVRVSGQTAGSSNNTWVIARKETWNCESNNYFSYGKIINSYLTEIDNHTLMRVENTENDLFAQYIKDGIIESTRNINRELPLFGGFFAGKDAYYLVFGQDNATESDSVEVIRVVKYDKNWNRLGACSLKKIDTHQPFEDGCLRMTEYNGVLYIHTCHTFYKEKDGLNHQANMTFEINEKDMTLKDSFIDPEVNTIYMVSHSFNQFIKTDGEKVYRIDQGDCNPRGIILSTYPIDRSARTSTKMEYLLHIPLIEQGDMNYTGVAIGGFELSSDGLLVAYSQHINDDINGISNIRVLFRQEDGTVTIHKFDSDTNCQAPALVKITDDQFLLMWKEGDHYKMVRLNAAGEQVSPIVAKNIRLSDCQPVCLSDGSVAWYATTENHLFIFKINPYQLDSIQGLSDQLELENTNEMEYTPGEDDFFKSIFNYQKRKPKLDRKIAAPYNKIAVGKKMTMQAVNMSGVKWSTSNKKYATISSKGVVKTKKKGAGKTVTIYATYKGKTYSYKIKIMRGVVKKITLSGKKKVKAGKKIRIKAKIKATKGANKKLAWKTNNIQYATVTSKGVVKISKKARGKLIKITATATDASNKKGSIKIKVK